MSSALQNAAALQPKYGGINMGLGIITAAMGGLGGVLADTWREYFYCDSLTSDVLVTKGQKRTSSRGRSANVKGEDNIISNGSVIAVNEGQFMLIVDQGKIVDFCGDAGEYIFDKSTEPSLFYGDLGTNIKDTFMNIGKRIGFGGDTGKDQRVYFFNKKEIIGNKYGTPNAVPFRVIDKNIGLDIDISVRCHGEYSYKLVNPLLFYTNVCGNVDGEYTRDNIDGQLKSELMTALQPAFARISEMGIRYSALPGHTTELSDALNTELSEKWTNLRGIAIQSFGVSSIKASDEDEAMLKQLQRSAVMRDPTMAAATLVGAQSQAMQDAAKNENGAMMGFMGMGMTQQAGGMNAANLFAMGQQNAAQQQSAQPASAAPAANGWKCECGTVNTGKFCAQCGAKKPEPKPDAAGWTCSCGTVNTGKFCAQCGAPRPADADGWKCSCGTVNKGKFCAQCGAKKPAGERLYKCDKCGWEPKDPAHPPKFCPECGDIFDDSDVK